ncbi:hypothetical protein [Agromyces sp. NPDC056965]|uniref:hypothetical protein n=1 Tax=Agromyces sp. NPDC056965 TaxID=3345983 RepID=UPI00363931D3
MQRRRIGRQGRAIVVLAVVGGCFLTGLSLLHHYWVNVRDPYFACTELFTPVESALSTLRGTGTWWPLGLSCTYEVSGVTSTVDTGWGLTIVALVGAALIAAGFSALHVPAKNSRPNT